MPADKDNNRDEVKEKCGCDYTEERKELLKGLTVDDIVAEIKKNRAEKVE